MVTPYVWTHFPPQQQFQPPATADSSPSHHSRSLRGSPHISPPVLPPTRPVFTAAVPVATQVHQPGLLFPGYTPSSKYSFGSVYVPFHPAAPAVTALPTVPAPYYTYSPWFILSTVQLQRPQLHDLINGEIIGHRLHINFSQPDLAFRKRTGSGPFDVATLSSSDLEQPAMNPQMKRVHIVCDTIPQWPVDLQVIDTSLSPPRPGRSALPYLTLEDVIYAIHASLHRKISHREWGRLSSSQETEVARTYTRRFRSSGSELAQGQQESEGVKRVDFLLRNCWFKGFTWLEPENGVERLKLLVGEEY